MGELMIVFIKLPFVVEICQNSWSTVENADNNEFTCQQVRTPRPSKPLKSILPCLRVVALRAGH